MKQFIFSIFLFIAANASFAQSRFSQKELSINGFRNPSIGLEYRYNHLSVHGGYYLTNFTSGETTRFIKAGVTYWFLAVDKKEIPSSFYAGASYLRGLNREYDGENAFAAELGFRWMVWKGFNLRLGVIALSAKGKDLKINPTPGISYSFRL
jgi:hypothetical protein